MSTKSPGRAGIPVVLERIPDPLLENRSVVFVEAIVSLVLLWSLIAHTFGLVDAISSPYLVAISLYNLLQSGEWVTHLWVTIYRVALGFLATLVIGTILGLMMGLSDFWDRALQDYITIGLAFPTLFIAVFTAMWFGTGDTTPIVAAAVSPFPFVAISVQKGIDDIDRRRIEVAESYNVSRRRIIRRIVLPSVMSEWFSGMRYAFAGAWKIVTLAELIAASSGIGYMIAYQMSVLSIEGVITWTVLFAIVVVVIEYGIFQQIEKRVFDWREETTVGWV